MAKLNGFSMRISDQVASGDSKAPENDVAKSRNPIDSKEHERLERAEARKCRKGANEATAETSKLRFTYIKASEARIRSQGVFLVEGILKADETTVWYGQPKSNKSTAVGDMMMHGSMGWDWMSRKIKRPLLCIFVAAERASVTESRLVAFKRHHGISESDPFPFVIVPARPNMRNSDDLAALVAVIREIEADFKMKAGIVAIDTLTQTFGDGSQRGDTEMTAYGRACTDLRAQMPGSHLIVIHHEKKMGVGDDKAGNGPKGAGELLGMADGAFQIRVEGNPEDRIRELHCFAHNTIGSGYVLTFSYQVVLAGYASDEETGDQIRVDDVVAVPSDRTASIDAERAKSRTSGKIADATLLHDLATAMRNEAIDKMGKKGVRVENPAIDTEKLLEKWKAEKGYLEAEPKEKGRLSSALKRARDHLITTGMISSSARGIKVLK